MRLLTLVIASLALAGLSCTPGNPSARERETPIDTLVPPVAQPSPTAVPNYSIKIDFDLAENLTSDELKDISDRVRSECDRRKLTDFACRTLSKQKLHAASVARWQADGKKWIVRDATSLLYRK